MNANAGEIMDSVRRFDDMIAPLALEAMQRRMDANISEAEKTEYIERLRSYGFNTGKSA